MITTIITIKVKENIFFIDVIFLKMKYVSYLDIYLDDKENIKLC